MTSENEDFNLEDLERMAEEGKTFLGDESLLDRIEKESLEKIDQRIGSNNPFKKYWKTLLFLTLACCLGLLLFNNLDKIKSPKGNVSIAQYDAPPFLLDQTQRSSQDDTTVLHNIKQLYAQEKYDLCSKLIEQQFQNPDVNLDLRVYLGICHIQEKEYQEAIKSLSQPVNELEDLRQWNLCLALLGNGQKEEAKSLLQELVLLPEFYNKKKAGELLNQL